MNIVFAGSVEIGHLALRCVVENGHTVSGVITLAREKAASTSGYVDFGPYCHEKKIPLLTCLDINSTVVLDAVHRWSPTLLVVCGWQRLLGDKLLAIPKKGCVGFHSSLLPHYRGRAPVNWAIIHGETVTGVTMFMLDDKADTGPIVGQEPVAVHPLDTCAEVYAKAADAVCSLLQRHLPALLNGDAAFRENFSARYPCMPKRTPEDGDICWEWPVLRVHNFVRALGEPYPGAFTEIFGERYYLWRGVPLHPELNLGLAPGVWTIVRGLGVVFGCGDGGCFLVTAGNFSGEPLCRPDTDQRLLSSGKKGSVIRYF